MQGLEGKIITQSFRVNTPGGRVPFDLLLPRDCERITGICTVADMHTFQNKAWPDTCVGFLNLRWPRPGDIFFQIKVEHDESHEDDYAPLGIQHPAPVPFGVPDFALSGHRYVRWEVNIPGKIRHLRGYFKDVFNETQGLGLQYSVTAFFFYETKQ